MRSCLPEYLEKVWEIVGRAALQQVLGTAEAQARNGLSGALEEDARLTALFLWTLQSTDAGAEPSGTGRTSPTTKPSPGWPRGFALPFDVVRRFAQPMGIDLDTWTGRIIGQEKGVVRLLPVAEPAKELFGEDGAAAASQLDRKRPACQRAAEALPRIGRRAQDQEPRPRQEGDSRR